MQLKVSASWESPLQREARLREQRKAFVDAIIKAEMEEQARRKKCEIYMEWLASVKQAMDNMEFYSEERASELKARRKKYYRKTIMSAEQRDLANPAKRYLFHVLKFEQTHNTKHATKALKLEKKLNFTWRDITEFYEED